MCHTVVMEQRYSCSMKSCCNCGELYAPKLDKSYRCAKCKSEYNRQHYLQNKAIYVARASARKSQVISDLITRLSEYLDAHPCVDCGESDPVVLEFDHVAGKNYEISNMVGRGHSWDSILREIAMCEVRCANCHRRITAKRANWMRHRLNG